MTRGLRRCTSSIAGRRHPHSPPARRLAMAPSGEWGQVWNMTMLGIVEDYFRRSALVILLDVRRVSYVLVVDSARPSTYKVSVQEGGTMIRARCATGSRFDPGGLRYRLIDRACSTRRRRRGRRSVSRPSSNGPGSRREGLWRFVARATSHVMAGLGTGNASSYAALTPRDVDAERVRA